MSEVYIDDFDPSVAYSGYWQSQTNETGSAMILYDNTDHYTNSSDAKATLTFTGILCSLSKMNCSIFFNKLLKKFLPGVSVMVYGVVGGSTTSKSSYSIDGSVPTIYHWNSSSEPGGLATLNYPALFYSSPILNNGQHILTISPLDDPTTVWFFLDYFIVAKTDNVSSSPVISSTFTTVSGTSVSLSETSSSLPTATFVTLTSSTSSVTSASEVSDVPPQPTSQISGDVNVNSATVPNHFRQTATIVGTVAVLAAFAFLTLASLWLCRRRRQESERRTVSTCQYPSLCMFDEVFMFLVSFDAAALAASRTSLPSVSSQMDEPPPFPPSYVMSDPPAYVSDIGPMVEVGNSQPLCQPEEVREEVDNHNPIKQTRVQSPN